MAYRPIPRSRQPQQVVSLRPSALVVGAFTPVTGLANQATGIPTLANTGPVTTGVGVDGKTWSLSGSGQYLTAAQTAVTAVPFTLLSVCTPTNIAATGCIATLSTTTVDNSSFGIRIVGGNVGAFAYSSAGAFNHSTFTGGVTNGTKCVVGGVFLSDASRTVYLNGVAGTPNTTNGAVNVIDKFNIGALRRNTGAVDYFPGRIECVFLIKRALTSVEMSKIKTPGDVYAFVYGLENVNIWVPVAAGGSSSTITQADGTSTAGSLGGSATAATTPTQASGTSTAASIAASATAAAGVTQADGASTAATLVGVASTGSTITQADGSTVASVLAGSATSSAAATQADGVSTVGTLAGSATAASVLSSADGSSSTSTAAGSATSAAALTQADGLSTVSTLTGAGTGIAAFTQADGVSTTGTLTGTGLAAGSSTITPAAGSTTAGAIAGSSTAIAAITQADGTTTAGTLSSSSVSPAVMTAGAGTSTTSTLAGSSIFAAAMTQASGATTASAFAASAVAACVAIAAAGASSAQALAGIPPNTSSLAGIVYEIPEDVRSSTVLADARGFTVLEDVRARPRPYNGFNYR